MTNLTAPLQADHLTDWVLVTVQGPDSEKYLQGQLTIDLTALAAEQHQLTAHCEAKGKVWSTLRLFRYQDGFTYLLRRSVAEQQIAQLKKYAIFAKVTIGLAEQYQLLAITGSQISAFWQRQTGYTAGDTDSSTQATVWQNEQGYWLYFATPSPRILLISALPLAPLAQQHSFTIEQTDQRWLAAEIAAGIAVIDLACSEQFIPQALNLQCLAAIDFHKGCYTGQETVARAKYRGANKRALYYLAGHAQGPIQAGDELAMQLGDNWRKTGTILAACPQADQQWLIQAVLANDLTADQALRVASEPDSQLTIMPLPYPVTTE